MSTTSKNRLPDICAARMQSTGEPIFIKRGETGYWPAADKELDVDEWNGVQGISRAQVEAMLFGSLFGFDKPGADPRHFSNQPSKGE